MSVILTAQTLQTHTAGAGHPAVYDPCGSSWPRVPSSQNYSWLLEACQTDGAARFTGGLQAANNDDLRLRWWAQKSRGTVTRMTFFLELDLTKQEASLLQPFKMLIFQIQFHFYFCLCLKVSKGGFIWAAKQTVSPPQKKGGNKELTLERSKSNISFLIASVTLIHAQNKLWTVFIGANSSTGSGSNAERSQGGLQNTQNKRGHCF